MNIKQEHLNKISTDLGADIPEFPLDGQFHHFSVDKKDRKPLWAVGKIWEFKNNPYYMVTYGDFRGSTKFMVASYELKDLSGHFKTAHNKAAKELEELAAREKDEKRREGQAKYRKRFYECSPTSAVSEYLRNKNIESNFSARVDYRNTLMIPVESVDDDGKIIFEGVQMVFRNTEGKWQKVFNTGLSKKGSFNRVTDFDLRKSEIIYLCEGFATACSVYMATQTPTVCAFDSGNLGFVIESLKQLNPDVKIIICADDDFQTVIAGRQFNVGISAALKCQRKFQNVTYRKPLFLSRINETDFNDLHVLEGLDVVRELLKINRAEFVDIVLLGHVDHKVFYYMSTQSKQIIPLKGYEHKADGLKTIANEKYWAEKYGKKDDGQADWAKIADTLFDRQREIGPFDLKRMRGLGVWNDNKRIFVNTGPGVYTSQLKRTMSNIDPHLGTKNFYKNEAGEEINFDDELTDEECLQIIRAFQQLRFSNAYDFFYVCGFIAVANVFQALDWRPHLWISGPAGSGKSWTLKQIGNLIHYKLKCKGSTVAGIKGELAEHAKAVVYDEAEASEMIEKVVELARQCSTSNDDKVLRGTQVGGSTSYEGNACFLFGSIEPPVMNKADDSRFFLMEMLNIENQTAEEFNKIYDLFKELEDFGKRLMVRMVKNFPVLYKNIEISKQLLRGKGIAAREADQLAVILAGFVMMNNRELLSEELFEQIYSTVELGQSDYTIRNDSDTTGDDVYIALWNTVIDPFNSQTVGTFVEKAINGQGDGQALGIHGIEVEIKNGKPVLYLASKNANLDAKMERVGNKNFRKLLSRSQFCLDKSIARRSKLFGMNNRRFTALSVIATATRPQH